MTQHSAAAAQQSAELIENVGHIADRLLATCATGGGNGGGVARSLLETALLVAAEAQQHLAEHQQRIATLEAMTFTDELTGLENRRGFSRQLLRTLALAERFGDTGVLAYIDLDDFKAINDGLGHQAGDAVLRHVAALLSDNVRATDFVARIGGDEFAAILVHSTPRGGRRRAAALERLLNAAVVPYGEFDIPVRASMGVKPYGPGDKPEALIARADTAMYRNKRAKPRILHPWVRRKA